MVVDYTVTVGNLLTMVGVFIAAVSAFVYQRFQIDNKATQKELDQLRLEITRDFVSTSHLKEVEARMTASMEVLANEIRGLRTDLLSLYKSGSRPSR